MFWVYASDDKYVYSYSAGINIIRQNLTSEHELLILRCGPASQMVDQH